MKTIIVVLIVFGIEITLIACSLAIIATCLYRNAVKSKNEMVKKFESNMDRADKRIKQLENIIDEGPKDNKIVGFYTGEVK